MQTGRKFKKHNLPESRKLYFIDTGLLAHLLRYPESATMQKGPMAGAFFENFIVTEALKCLLNSGVKMELYCVRDSNGNEVDLIMESAEKMYLLEIQLAKTPAAKFAAPIRRMLPSFENAEGRVLSFSEQSYSLADGIKIVPCPDLYNMLGNCP